MSNKVIKRPNTVEKSGPSALKAPTPRPKPPSNWNLDRHVKETKGRRGDFRRVEPVFDLMESMDLVPNKLVAKEPPSPISLRPTDLWIDGAYQRDLTRASIKLIMRIIENFTWQKYKSPVVTKDVEGRYIIIDGQHTSIACATHPEIDKIPCMFVPIETVEKQALAFIAHNMENVRVQSLDLFHARLTAGDENAIIVQEVLNKYNIAILRHVPGQKIAYEINQTMATATLEKLLKKHGRARFNEIVNITAQCNFKPIRADHFQAIANVLYERGAEEPSYSPELLAELVKSLDDSDCIYNAQRIAHNLHTTKAKALAVYYKNKYQQAYS